MFDTDKKKFLAIAVLIGLVYIFLLFFMPKDSFWITDGGNKFIQLNNLLENGTSTIQYPASDIDPDMRFFPYSAHHFRKIDGQMYSFYPVYFSLISAPFYKVFGWFGLFILPLFSTLFCFYFLYRMMEITEFPGGKTLPLLLLAFASPVFFYSLTFWEHTPVVLLSTISGCLMLTALKEERRAVGCLSFAGLLLGLAVVLREESYIFFAASAGAVLFTSSGRWKNLLFLSAGFMVVIIPLWIFQYMTYGHILGLHAVIYGELMEGTPLLSKEGIMMKLSNFFVYLFRFDSAGEGKAGVTTLLVIPFIGTAILGFCLKRFKGWTAFFRSVLLLLCGICAFLLSLRIMENPEPLSNTLRTQSLISSAPFLLIFLVSTLPVFFEGGRLWRFMALLCLFYIAGTCLCLNQNDIGIIWSGRHFLAIFPIIVLLACFALFRMLESFKVREFKIILLAAAGLLVLSSIMIQLHGVRTLMLKKKVSSELVEAALSTEPEIIVSDVYWLPEDTAPIFFRKKIMQIKSDEELKDFLNLMRANDITTFTLALSPKFRRISNDAIKDMMRSYQLVPGKTVLRKGAELFEIQFFTCKQK